LFAAISIALITPFNSALKVDCIQEIRVGELVYLS
jgi:hypothetical protein